MRVLAATRKDPRVEGIVMFQWLRLATTATTTAATTTTTMFCISESIRYTKDMFDCPDRMRGQVHMHLPLFSGHPEGRQVRASGPD